MTQDNVFVPLKSMDNNFGINRQGKVKNFKTNKIISSYIGIDCYEHIVLCYKGKRYRKRVHRLMAEAFFNNAKYIDHIDNNKSNNDIPKYFYNSNNIQRNIFNKHFYFTKNIILKKCTNFCCVII